MRWGENLPEALEFEGEFGAEINSFVPFVHWAWRAGALEQRRVITYRGMAPFYCFLPAWQVVEQDRPRRWVAPEARPLWLPTRDDHGARNRAFEWFPDYRAWFANELFAEERPILVLHNKFCDEWGQGPVNFIDPELLARTLEILGERFAVYYSRPGITAPGTDYSVDHQPDFDLNERDVLKRFPGVRVFEDLAAQLAPVHGYNQLKLMLYANCFGHITVQGGNAHLAALFGGSKILILHRAGQEIRYSYRQGHFSHAAQPTPRLTIAQNDEEFLGGVGEFVTIEHGDGLSVAFSDGISAGG